jgi:hypothetical protein
VLPIVAAIFAIVTATIATTTAAISDQCRNRRNRRIRLYRNYCFYYILPLASATVYDHHTLPTPVSTANACFYCQRLFLLPTLSLDVVFDNCRFLPLRLNFYGYLHRRRKGRFLPSPLATASIRNRHGSRNRTRQDRNPDAYRLLCTPFSTVAAFYRCRNLSTPFSIDAVKFLPTPFVFYWQHILSPLHSTATVFCRCLNLSTPFLWTPLSTAAVAIDTACYRHRLLSTPLAIDTACYRYRLLSTPLAIDTACFRHRLLSTPLAIDTACYRHRLLSTPLAIDTACYRHRLLSKSLAIDTACYRHRLLPPPFSIPVFTAAIFDRNRYDRNSTGSRTLHFVMMRTE